MILKKNKYGYFDDFKEENKFKKPKIVREKKPADLYNDLYKEYYEDLKLKINNVKNGEILIKKLSSDEDMDIGKKSESNKILPKIQPTGNISKSKTALFILDEHFK